MWYLVRHGQTEANLERRAQGILDTPLTETGRLHAERVARFFAGIRVDATYCSPLGRALATARPLVAVTRTALVVDDRLREIDCGLTAGCTPEEVERHFPGLRERKRRDRVAFTFPGGESFRSLDRRVADFMRANANDAVQVVVAHKAVLRSFVATAARLTVAEAEGLRFDGAQVYRIDGGVLTSSMV